MGLELWNKLPNNVKDSGSIDLFKKKLQTFLFDKIDF